MSYAELHCLSNFSFQRDASSARDPTSTAADREWRHLHHPGRRVRAIKLFVCGQVAECQLRISLEARLLGVDGAGTTLMESVILAPANIRSSSIFLRRWRSREIPATCQTSRYGYSLANLAFASVASPLAGRSGIQLGLPRDRKHFPQ